MVSEGSIAAALVEAVPTVPQWRLSTLPRYIPADDVEHTIRYLAERMGLEVVQKRASDLMSKWVGGTAKQIAEAFAEARDAGSFLVFDEADSVLADRRFAERPWEVSQVNEMLTWMENHPLPFACTTNFAEHLDRATLRRFVFKVTLDHLSPEQVRAAFRGFFALSSPSGLTQLTALTPGDFAVVRRRADALGRLGEAGESQLRPGEGTRARPSSGTDVRPGMGDDTQGAVKRSI